MSGHLLHKALIFVNLQNLIYGQAYVSFVQENNEYSSVPRSLISWIDQGGWLFRSDCLCIFWLFCFILSVLRRGAIIVIFLFFSSICQFLLNTLWCSVIKHIWSYNYCVFLTNWFFYCNEIPLCVFDLLFVLKSFVWSDINIATPAYFCLLLARHIFFHPFTSYLSLFFVHIVCLL